VRAGKRGDRGARTRPASAIESGCGGRRRRVGCGVEPIEINGNDAERGGVGGGARGVDGGEQFRDALVEGGRVAGRRGRAGGVGGGEASLEDAARGEALLGGPGGGGLGRNTEQVAQFEVAGVHAGVAGAARGERGWRAEHGEHREADDATRWSRRHRRPSYRTPRSAR
jgi:hypothetical protein